MLKKARSGRYSVETITDVDYPDDIPLLGNTPTQAESLLHKIETWVLNEKEPSPLKVDKFTYMGNGVASTKSDVNIRLVKA